MDRLASLEYSLMSDIFDDYANEASYADYNDDDNYALESYDDYDDVYDEYASQYDDYDEAFEGSKEPKPPKTGGFGQYMKVSAKGKIRAFFRAVIHRIATFFLKLGNRIKMLLSKKENKQKYSNRIAELEKDNLIANAAGRIGDICRRAKKPAIKVVESLRKLFTGTAGTAKNINAYQTCADNIKRAESEIEQCWKDSDRIFQHIAERCQKLEIPVSEGVSIMISVVTDKAPKEYQELSDCLTAVGVELNRFDPDAIISASNDRYNVAKQEYVRATAGSGKNIGDIEPAIRDIATALNEFYAKFREFAVAMHIRPDQA